MELLKAKRRDRVRGSTTGQSQQETRTDQAEGSRFRTGSQRRPRLVRPELFRILERSSHETGTGRGHERRARRLRQFREALEQQGASFGMGRKRTKLTMAEAEAAQIKVQIRAATNPRDKERLQVVIWATSGQHTLAELALLAGRARSTIQVWLDDFTDGGVARLLEREAPPGKPSLVAEAKVQTQLKAGLKAGQWRTAGQVAAWLKETHGIQRATKSLYYWLGKVGGALRVPRPCHVQQNPAARAAFRAELEQNLEKLNLPKDRAVKIWVADEARFGLHTQSRRCWALRGHRVVLAQEQRYEWE